MQIGDSDTREYNRTLREREKKDLERAIQTLKPMAEKRCISRQTEFYLPCLLHNNVKQILQSLVSYLEKLFY